MMRVHEKEKDPGGAGGFQLSVGACRTLITLSLHPTGTCSSASPFPMAWSPWPWWTPGMKCQTKPSKFATGLGTLGPWGCLIWKSLVTTRTAERLFLNCPTTCQLTCVWRREAWIRVRHSQLLPAALSPFSCPAWPHPKAGDGLHDHAAAGW